MLSAADVRQLDGLMLGSVAVAPTPGYVGARTARVRGYGADFSDYRRYEPGDDPRRIDWTIHARLRQLVVRAARADAHLSVHLLVDSSASMGVGRASKMVCARRVAAALAYVALDGRDLVSLTTFDGKLHVRCRAATGDGHGRRLLAAVDAIDAAGATAMSTALAEFAAAVQGPGLAVIVSDFFDAGDPLRGLRRVMDRGLLPAVLQVLADEDVDPSFDDETELFDSEEPARRRPLIADARAVASYRARLQRHSDLIGQFCSTHGIPWAQIRSSWPFTRVLQACVDAHLLSGRR